MPVAIKNLTLRPVLMRLNSGVALHLSPGMTSDAIDDEELDRNQKVAKLQERHVVALTEVEATVRKVTPAKTIAKSRKR
ncbi:MAG: hypothetical protein OEY21_03145 [Nitrospira sp.]|nr:hypothetical protein [Nitrospira sp.]MDH5625077.1 hypothetical protein [Nitrospira sp.]